MPGPSHPSRHPGEAVLGGRILFGNLSRKGMEIEWCDFPGAVAGGRACGSAPDSVEIWINFSGELELPGEGGAVRVSGEQVAVRVVGRGEASVRLCPGRPHRFFLLRLSRWYLRLRLEKMAAWLQPEMRRMVQGSARSHVRVAAMDIWFLVLRFHLLDPPVTQGARPLWYLSQVNEILACLLFREEAAAESAAQRRARLNRERCRRAAYLLERDMKNPPSLEMLAGEVGCSPFHLSRLFAKEMGCSIPRFIRLTRLNKAARLLRERKLSITEAALEVGYAGLSGLSQACQEHFGCNPTELTSYL